MASGVEVDDEAVNLFTDMKMRKYTETPDGKKIRKKAVVFCINGDKIVTEADKEILSVDDDEEHEDPLKRFINLLPENGCRYALYDAAYETEDNKKCQDLVFVMWSPDTCGVRDKMLYASSKDAIRKKFTGLKHNWEVKGREDLENRCTVADKLRGHGACLKTLEGKPL
uniref:Cofilin-2-like n=1 Tax=Salarias fasciatus TaxID=181472 RepID=A0A672HL20_SALFA